MNYRLLIVAAVLLVYALPIFLITSLIFLYTSDNSWVSITYHISKNYYSNLRDVFGPILVPLVTAYSLKIADKGQVIEGQSAFVFILFLALFVGAILLAGFFELDQVARTLATHNENAGVKKEGSTVISDGLEISQLFAKVTQAYAREALTYMAMTIGISAAKK